MLLRWMICASVLALFPFSAFADVSDVGPQPFLVTPLPHSVTWVATNGSDVTGDGSALHPFLTPAHAARLGQTIVIAPGRYAAFGTITRGGTDRDPLVIRAASGTVTFALQDASEPATIAASHIQLDGIDIQNAQLTTPKSCLQLGADVEDVEIDHARLNHCPKAIDTHGFRWSHGALQDVQISDIQNIGIDCSGVCTSQRWNRLLIQHIGDETTSGTAIIVSDHSADLRLRDVIVRDVSGDGAIFDGGKPSIANSWFIQISGTSLVLKEGGFVGHTQVDTGAVGLEANIGTNLVIEHDLFHALTPTATPFTILSDHPSATSTNLLLTWSRFDIPNGQLRLGGQLDQHRVVMNGCVFWFRATSDQILLPGGQTINEYQVPDVKSIEQHEDTIFYTTPPITGDLFSAIFSGGMTTRNQDTSRTITEGSQVRGTEEDPPYVLGQEQHTHLLPSPEMTARWYPYHNEITTIGTNPFSALTRGLDVTEPPGTLIKATSRPEVYLVTAPNMIRWVSSEELAYAYDGPRWNEHILVLPDEDLTHYQEDDAITSVADFSDDDVLRQLPDPADLFEQ